MNVTDRPSSKYNNTTNKIINENELKHHIRTMFAHQKTYSVWLKKAPVHNLLEYKAYQCQSNFNSNIELNSNERPIDRFQCSIQREAVSMMDLNNNSY